MRCERAASPALRLPRMTTWPASWFAMRARLLSKSTKTGDVIAFNHASRRHQRRRVVRGFRSRSSLLRSRATLPRVHRDKSRTGRCARGGRCPPPSRARRCQRLGRPETTGLTILSAAERPVDRRVFRDWAFLGVQFFRRRHSRDGDAAFPARRGAGGRHQDQSAARIQAAGLDSGSTDYSQRVDRR